MTAYKLQDFYTKPTTPIKSQFETLIFGNETVEFKYNSHGYRTHEFVDVGPHVVVSGCSLTQGHGLHIHQTWARQLESRIDLKVFNLAKGNGSSDIVNWVLQNWIAYYKPNLVIVQWPNPYRSLAKNSDQTSYGIENFHQFWCSDIISLNNFCKLENLPIVNLCFESYDVVGPGLPILQKFEIDLHYDKKEPGQTWHFDNQALDRSHHSEWCNSKWTDRILTIIKDLL